MVMRLLIANRGEIACRIIRSARMRGVETVAVFTDEDANAPHRWLADSAINLDGDAMAYLDGPRLIHAAHRASANAVHPGYGFLSQSPVFAQSCTAAGLLWVGPSPEAITILGDKRASRVRAEAAGVPVIPGAERVDDVTMAERLAQTVGFPLLLKAAGGGGGKGMRLVERAGQLADAFESAQREAQAAFGDARLLLERYISPARHIEVQILGDGGSAVALGVRECSLQRRYQKILEEAPPATLAPAIAQTICQDAERLMKSVRYKGAGTVEFLVDAQGAHFFLEVNTRLQVEHPVTELLTGVDIVAEQLRIAAGGRVTQPPLSRGHAIEVRINAEDPANGYLPSTGRIEMLAWPSVPGVRVDAGIQEGQEITATYDPLLAKIIAYGASRPETIARLRQALSELVLLGVKTNQSMLMALLSTRWFFETETYTNTLEAWTYNAVPLSNAAKQVADAKGMQGNPKIGAATPDVVAAVRHNVGAFRLGQRS